jgi:PAS domain S-box-containing protein
MGYIFFKALDNALLFESAYPSTDLFLTWRGKVVASSSGETDNAGLDAGYTGTLYRGRERYEQLAISWGQASRDSPVLVLQQRVDRLFTPMEMVAAALVALSVLTLFTWFTVGFWLTRIAARIEALRQVSSRFALDSSVTPELSRLVESARADGRDEIGAVADAVDAMMHAVMRRREELRGYQEVLRSSESKLRSYFDLSVDGIAVVDGEGRFLEVNPACCNMLGYSEAELKRMSLADLKAADGKSLTASRESFRQLLVTGRSAGEVGYLRQDGGLVVLDIHGVALGGDRFLELMRDVTERRRMEEMLQRQMEELARMNLELDEFTYMASHDLQEPLRKLVTFSDLLRRDAEGLLPPAAEADIDFISDAATRMRSLVRDLLALSRAGKSEMRQEPVELDEAADRALDALAIAIREAGAEISRDRLPEVRGDVTLLTQLYQNLIGNALKYAGDGAPRIHPSAEATNGEWIFGVRDNGIGVEPAFAELVFQPFKRLHGRGKYGGTGIGLAICRKVVERHGGHIWVESGAGRGAHFRFTLQVARP